MLPMRSVNLDMENMLMKSSHIFTFRMLTAMAAATLCISCVSLPQTYHSTQYRTFTLGPNDLSQYGLAFITPSTVTGQEEEKQAVAFTFSEVLYTQRPDIPIRTLPQTLSAVNKAGLEKQYTQMFEDYRSTSLFKTASLKEVAGATGMRYLGQLKLSGFQQGSDGRLGVFGLRILNTKQASIRLFFQIWDSEDGSIVWEGVDELQHSMDTATEETVTLKKVLEKASGYLVSQLPKRTDSITRP
jgi:hypothetical protein